MKISTIKKYFNKTSITPADLFLFLRQLATLINAGVSLLAACNLLEKSQYHPPMQALIYTIKRDILSGHSLYHSMRKHQRYFDNLTLQLIHIGEQTGKLDTNLIAIVNYLENTLTLQRKIKQQLFYPCIITFIACLISACMLIFIIPHFSELFSDMLPQLPFYTRWLFNLSAFLRQHGWVILLLLIGAGFLLRYRMQKSMLSILLNRLPLFKQFLQLSLTIQFIRHLSIMLNAGMVISNALQLYISTHHHPGFTKTLYQVQQQIRAGMPLHQALANHHIFPPLLIQMTKIGEETGMLDAMLNKAADFFSADVELLTGRLTQLLEPMIILILGTLIGGMVIGMYLPIFKLGSAL